MKKSYKGFMAWLVLFCVGVWAIIFMDIIVFILFNNSLFFVIFIWNEYDNLLFVNYGVCPKHDIY